MDKAQLRRYHLQQRDALPVEQRIELALALADHRRALQSLTEGRIVGAYHPIRSELDPRRLMAALRNVRLCLPAIVGKTSLQFRELSRTSDLVDAGGFGTVAPPEQAPVLDPDILLMPLAVFDRDGGRIGYGGGFYDRAIATLRAKGANPVLIGLAFDEQEAAHIPQETHDVALHHILTPTRFIKANPIDPVT